MIVAIAAPFTPSFKVKIKIGSKIILVIAPIEFAIIAPLLFARLIRKLAKAI